MTDKDRLMYISVHDGSTMWITDMPVNPRAYGCVTIKENQHGISGQPSNPKPRWIRANAENDDNRSLISEGLVEVYSRQSPSVSVYFGQVAFSTAELPPVILFSCLCGVRFEPERPFCLTDTVPPLRNLELSLKFIHGFNKVVSSTDLLANPGYEWVEAQRGNTVPPNAVKTSVCEQGRGKEWYLGRINGDTVCGITKIDGMIDYFVPSEGSKTTSGEILLLTSDPNIQSNMPASVQKNRNEADTEEIESEVARPQEMKENAADKLREYGNSIISFFRANGSYIAPIIIAIIISSVYHFRYWILPK